MKINVKRLAERYLGFVLWLTFIVVVGQLCGCATTEHVVKEVETKNIDVKGHTYDGEIAINEKGQAIIQVQKTAEYELRVQEMVNYDFMERVRDEAFQLNDCRVQMADPKNGGSGEVDPIPSVDNLKPVTKVKEEMGLDEEGSLKVVTKEFLDERLVAERRYQSALETMIHTIKPLRETCQRKLGYKKSASTATMPWSDRTTEIHYVSK